MIKAIGLIGMFTAAWGTAASAPLPAHFSERARELIVEGAGVNDSPEAQRAAGKLNVIYFVGRDSEPVPDYRRRLSELLLYVQQFYGREMARHGFGFRPPILPMNAAGEVDMILLRGRRRAEEYPNSAEAAQACLEEIDDYFRTHPERKLSGHRLIIMPTRRDAEFSDANPGGVPVFALGHDCFTLDYKEFDLKHLGQDTEYGHLLTKMFGGFAHELGHCMALPHNNGPVSELKQWGTPLMGSGNYTFGMKPTYMTKASCAVMDVCELVPPRESLPGAYYQPPAEPITGVEVDISWEGDQLHIVVTPAGAGGKLVRSVNVYVQDPPYELNQDYDAVAFYAQREESGQAPQFTCSIPRHELSGLTSDEHRVSVLLLMPNGFRYRWNAEFRLSELKEAQPVPCYRETFIENDR